MNLDCLAQLSRLASIMLALPLVLSTARAEAGLDVRVRLQLDGKDVTVAHGNDVVQLLPVTEGPDGWKPGEVTCLVKDGCDVPPGTYNVDLESRDFIVETHPELVVEPGGPNPVEVSLNVALAAFVTVPGLPVGGALQALDERTARLRHQSVSGPMTALRIPARSQILFAYDLEARPLGCWPIRPKPSETLALRGLPRLPKGRGQLFVDLVYPSRDAPHDLSIALKVGDSVFRPDAAVSVHPDRHFAVWYDVPSGPGTLEVTSKFWTLAGPDAVEVLDRALSVRKAIPLARRPSLNVRFLQPEILGTGEVEVELLVCDKLVELQLPPIIPFCREPVSRRGNPRETFSFPDLLPVAYALRWTKSPFQAARWMDLREGRSRDEEIPIELSKVSGRVTRRGDGYPASLLFEAVNTGVGARVATDQGGHYNVVLGQPAGYSVVIHGEGGPDHSGGCNVVPGTPETRCDFDVPANAVVVHVQTEDGSPVPSSARVHYEVNDPPPSIKVLFGPGSGVVDAEGSVALPPLPNGILSVSARADGYRVTSAAPFVVTDETAKGELTVVLRKGAGIRFTILDPSGRPAPGVRVWTRRDYGYGVETDSNGVAQWEQPLPAGSPLLGYDVSGRMMFTRYSGDQEQTLRFPAPGPPFLVRFQSPDGAPIPRSNVAVAVDGVLDDRRLSDQLLAAGGDPYSGPDGTLRVAGLPASGLLTIFPWGRPDLAVNRNLPVNDEIVFTLPLPAADSKRGAK